jgi:hypothetical protein
MIAIYLKVGPNNKMISSDGLVCCILMFTEVMISVYVWKRNFTNFLGQTIKRAWITIVTYGGRSN